MNKVSYFEGTSSYYVDDIIDNKIEEVDLSLTAEENFKRKFNKFKEFFSRKNILKFGIMIGEEAISIENTQGNIVISTIHKTQIEKRIETFSEKEKSKIGYIHISTIQILIKSTFMKGIDSPLEIALEDSTILDKRQAKIAQVKFTLKSHIFRNLARNSFSLIEAEKYLFEETEKPLIRN
ncbi:viral movement protein [Medicago truncatula]|uniref:Viral movement protein n=1 Tax=Medicago truncatula TaxID=3880 RepID=A0A072UII5_MEDTR|nr:viral movement protein [Medicago truncatula]